MDKIYQYEVVIRGLDSVPMRTSREGAEDLLGVIHGGDGKTCRLILEAVDDGTPFKNKYVRISKVRSGGKAQKTVRRMPKKSVLKCKRKT